MQGGVSCTRPCMASSAETLHARVNLHGRAKETEAEPHMTVFRTRPCEVGREGSGAGRVSLTRPCHGAVWHPCQAYKRGFLPLFSHLGLVFGLGLFPIAWGRVLPLGGTLDLRSFADPSTSGARIASKKTGATWISFLFSLCFEL